MSDREEESQSERGFKVEDRRRFAATGEPRAEATESEPAANASETKPAEEPETAADASRQAAPSEITFSAFAFSLSHQALIHLGEIPDPHGGEPQVDLVAAQQLIDILAVLQEKTRGNLDAAEENLLESVLYDLRLRFVERAKRVRNA